jgi:NADPH-dependent 2,4-dienoyl-CoA reductase/sulfur reductase-like enzyme
VLATGARDRPVPFPAWTLPGVMTAGGAQALAKAHWVRPGQKIVLAGSGPFLLPVAKTILESGARIVALLEATGPRDWAPHAPALWGQWERGGEAWRYWRALRRARVPVLYRHRLLAAVGEDHVTGARIAAVDADWRAVPGTERLIPADAIAVGFGFVPNAELAELCGCAMRWDIDGQAWFVISDGAQQTSMPGIFAAGEITGIGGAAIALLEGTAAGLSAAAHSGRIGSAAAAASRLPLSRSLRRHGRFAAMLNRLFTPRPALWNGLDDAVTVCRCEEVSCETIRQSIRAGCGTPKEVKDWTRAGMGPCQGRVCGSLVARLLAEERGGDPGAVIPPRVRPPIKPVPMRVLVESEQP